MTLPRSAAALLGQMARGFPVIAITGPRQSGKSTLAREAFPRHPYVTLEDPDTRALARADPRRFLARFPGGAVLDEVQRVPELLSVILLLTLNRFVNGLVHLTMASEIQKLAKKAGLDPKFESVEIFSNLVIEACVKILEKGVPNNEDTPENRRTFKHILALRKLIN